MPVRLGRRQGESVTSTQSVSWEGRQTRTPPAAGIARAAGDAGCVQGDWLASGAVPCPHGARQPASRPSRGAGSAWAGRCCHLCSLLVEERLVRGLLPWRTAQEEGKLCGSVHAGVPRWIAPTGGARDSLTGSPLTGE